MYDIFKTVNEYVDWIRAERISYPEVREEFSKGSSFYYANFTIYAMRSR